MAQYGITKTTQYQLINGRWHKREEWTEPHAIIDYSHWEEWRRWDSNGSRKRATLRGQCGYMLSYTAYSPNSSEMIKVELLRYISGGSYLSYFDKLDNISDKDYKKLEKKARTACARKAINFDKEACYISSTGVAHGFYFPNLKNYRGIFFCKGEAVLVPSSLAE